MLLRRIGPLGILRIVGLVLLLLAGLAMHVLTPLPRRDIAPPLLPRRYVVPASRSYEVQGHNQCSAFATAFVLRSLGHHARGSDVYRELSYRLPLSGYVLPKGIVRYLQKAGLDARLMRGNLRSLKGRLTQGRPVILLIGKGTQWQHYMTLVGYDTPKRELYFFDSGKRGDENAQQPGNRTIREGYFLNLWNNGVAGFSRIYIVIRPATP